MASSLSLLVAGILGRLVETETWWVLFAVGTLGWTITALRCAMFAWQSDLSGLPPIGPWSRTQSLYLYRALIAWLHLMQPIARFRGNLRGLSLSQGVADQHVTRHPWKTARRSWTRAVRLLTGGRSEVVLE
jgi:hypothetical protein